MTDKVKNHVWSNREHIKLHYTTIHYTLLDSTTLHIIKLHYTTLVYVKLLNFEAKLTNKNVPLRCVKFKKKQKKLLYIPEVLHYTKIMVKQL